jgi:hypothetical protein
MRKLARLQEHASEIQEAIAGQFARYRQRLSDAEECRRAALVAATGAAQHLAVAQLLELPETECSAIGVSANHLRAAEQHLAAAEEIKAAMERRRDETAGFTALVRRLEKYVEGSGSLHA